MDRRRGHHFIGAMEPMFAAPLGRQLNRRPPGYLVSRSTDGRRLGGALTRPARLHTACPWASLASFRSSSSSSPSSPTRIPAAGAEDGVGADQNAPVAELIRATYCIKEGIPLGGPVGQRQIHHPPPVRRLDTSHLRRGILLRAAVGGGEPAGGHCVSELCALPVAHRRGERDDGTGHAHVGGGASTYGHPDGGLDRSGRLRERFPQGAVWRATAAGGVRARAGHPSHVATARRTVQCAGRVDHREPALRAVESVDVGLDAHAQHSDGDARHRGGGVVGGSHRGAGQGTRTYSRRDTGDVAASARSQVGCVSGAGGSGVPDYQR
eukprot:ctg_100.g117